MGLYKGTYHSDVYTNFKAIEVGEHRTLIRFFSAYREGIDALDAEEQFELYHAYANALAETRNYDLHIDAAAKVVELSLIENIKFYEGKDVLFETLLRKADSHFQIHEYEKADYILRELLKIEPESEFTNLFLKRCLRKHRQGFLQKARAVTIFLLLTTALIVCAELLFIRPFWKAQIDLVENIRIATFFGAIGFFGLCDLVHRAKIHFEVEEFIRAIKLKKQKTAK